MKKKEVLFVIDSLVVGGVSKVLINLLAEIDYSKYKIDLLVLNYHGDMISNIPKEVNIIKGTKRFDVIDYSFKQLIKERRFVKAIKKIYFSFIIKTGSVKLLIKNERKKILHKRYDNEISYNDGFCTLFCAFGDSLNKINWNHVDISVVNASRKYKQTMIKALKLIDTNVSVSKEAAVSFKKYYDLNKEPKVILNVIDEGRIIEKSKETISNIMFDDEYINILSVGRLDYQKAYDRYIGIHKKLIDDGFKFKVYIIGDGCQRDLLQNKIKEYNIEDSLILLGKKQNPYPYFLNVDFSLLVSRYEGMPTVVSESLVLGCPVVSTNVAGIDYLLDNGKYGIIIKNNEDGIYNGLKNVLLKKDLLNTYKKNLVKYSSKNEDKLAKFYMLLN